MRPPLALVRKLSYLVPRAFLALSTLCVLALVPGPAVADYATTASDIMLKAGAGGAVSDCEVLFLMSQPLEFQAREQAWRAQGANVSAVVERALRIRQTLVRRVLDRLEREGIAAAVAEAYIALGSWAAQFNAGDMDLIIKGNKAACARFNRYLGEEIEAVMAQGGMASTVEPFEIYVSNLSDFGYDKLARVYQEALEKAVAQGEAAGRDHLRAVADDIWYANLQDQHWAGVHSEYYPGRSGREWAAGYLRTGGKSRVWFPDPGGAWVEQSVAGSELSQAMLERLGLTCDIAAGQSEFPRLCHHLRNWLERTDQGAREQAKELVRACEGGLGKGFWNTMSADEKALYACARAVANCKRGAGDEAVIQILREFGFDGGLGAFSEMGAKLLRKLVMRGYRDAASTVLKEWEAGQVATKLGRLTQGELHQILTKLKDSEKLAGLAQLSPDELWSMSRQLTPRPAPSSFWSFTREMSPQAELEIEQALLECMAQGGNIVAYERNLLLRKLVGLARQGNRVSETTATELLQALENGGKLTPEAEQLLAVLRRDLADLAATQSLSPPGRPLSECLADLLRYRKQRPDIPITTELEEIIELLATKSPLELLDLGFKDSEISRLIAIYEGRKAGREAAKVGASARASAPHTWRSTVAIYAAFASAVVLSQLIYAANTETLSAEQKRQVMADALAETVPTIGFALQGLVAGEMHFEGFEVDQEELTRSGTFAAVELGCLGAELAGVSWAGPAACVVLAGYGAHSYYSSVMELDEDRLLLTALYNASVETGTGRVLKVKDANQGTRRLDATGSRLVADATSKSVNVVHSPAYQDLYGPSGDVVLDLSPTFRPYDTKVNEALHAFVTRHALTRSESLKAWATAVRRYFPGLELEKIESWDYDRLVQQRGGLDRPEVRVGNRLLKRYLNERDLLIESGLQFLDQRVRGVARDAAMLDTWRERLATLERPLGMEGQIVPNAWADQESLWGWFMAAWGSDRTRIEQVVQVWRDYVATYVEALTVLDEASGFCAEAGLQRPSGRALLALVGQRAKDLPKVPAVRQELTQAVAEAREAFRMAKGSPVDKGDPFDAEAWKRLLAPCLRLFLNNRLAEAEKLGLDVHPNELDLGGYARNAPGLRQVVATVQQEIRDHYKLQVIFEVVGPTTVPVGEKAPLGYNITTGDVSKVTAPRWVWIDEATGKALREGPALDLVPDKPGAVKLRLELHGTLNNADKVIGRAMHVLTVQAQPGAAAAPPPAKPPTHTVSLDAYARLPFILSSCGKGAGNLKAYAFYDAFLSPGEALGMQLVRRVGERGFCEEWLAKIPVTVEIEGDIKITRSGPFDDQGSQQSCIMLDPTYPNRITAVKVSGYPARVGPPETHRDTNAAGSGGASGGWVRTKYVFQDTSATARRLDDNWAKIRVDYVWKGEHYLRRDPGPTWEKLQADPVVGDICFEVAVRLDSPTAAPLDAGPRGVTLVTPITEPREEGPLRIIAAVSGTGPADGVLQYAWSGVTTSQQNQAVLQIRDDGKTTVSCTVTNARGEVVGTDSVDITAELPKELTLTRIPAGDNTVVVGQATDFQANLTFRGRPVTGDIIYRWEPHPEVRYTAHEGPETSTRAVFLRPGKVRVWVEALRREGKFLRTIAASDQIELEATKPVLSLAFDPPVPLIGQATKVKVSTVPPLGPQDVDFRWEFTGNLRELGESQDTRERTFYARDVKPVTWTARARLRFLGDDLGEVTRTVVAQAFQVTATVGKPLGPSPMIWTDNGLTEAENAIAVHQNVPVTAAIKPVPERQPVHYRWSANPDTHFVTMAEGAEVTVNRSRPGLAQLRVDAFDDDGSKLGTATVEFNVTISQEALDQGQQKAQEQADRKRIQLSLQAGRTRVPRGSLTAVETVIVGAKDADQPLQFAWTGPHEGEGAGVSFRAERPGRAKLKVRVTGKRFPLGEAEIEFEVFDVKVTIAKTAPAGETVRPATTATLAARLEADGKPLSGKFLCRWESLTGVTFDPPEGETLETRATFPQEGEASVILTVLEYPPATPGRPGVGSRLPQLIARADPWHIEVTPRDPVAAAAALTAARAAVAQGKLDDGLAQAATAAKLDPTSAEARDYITKLKAEQATVMQHLASVTQALKAGDFPAAQRALSAAAALHGAWQPVVDATQALEQAQAASQRLAAARRLLDETSKRYARALPSMADGRAFVKAAEDALALRPDDGPLQQVLAFARKRLEQRRVLEAEPGALPKVFRVESNRWGAALTSTYPRSFCRLSFTLRYFEPGTVLDMVGIAGANPGALSMLVLADGTLRLHVYEPRLSSDRKLEGSAWHGLSSAQPLAPGVDHTIAVEQWGDHYRLRVDDQPVQTMNLPTRFSGQEIWIGDTPVDAVFGESANIHPAMIGLVRDAKVEPLADLSSYWGPAYRLEAPAGGGVLVETYPRGGLRAAMALKYTKPGTLLGMAQPPGGPYAPGAFHCAILPDGRLSFALASPAGAAGGVRLDAADSREPLAPGVMHYVVVTLRPGGAYSLWVDDCTESGMNFATGELSGKPVVLGAVPGGPWPNQPGGVAGGLDGEVYVKYLGPADGSLPGAKLARELVMPERQPLRPERFEVLACERLEGDKPVGQADSFSGVKSLCVAVRYAGLPEGTRLMGHFEQDGKVRGERTRTIKTPSGLMDYVLNSPQEMPAGRYRAVFSVEGVVFGEKLFTVTARPAVAPASADWTERTWDVVKLSVPSDWRDQSNPDRGSWITSAPGQPAEAAVSVRKVASSSTRWEELRQQGATLEQQGRGTVGGRPASFYSLMMENNTFRLWLYTLDDPLSDGRRVCVQLRARADQWAQRDATLQRIRDSVRVTSAPSAQPTAGPRNSWVLVTPPLDAMHGSLPVLNNDLFLLQEWPLSIALERRPDGSLAGGLYEPSFYNGLKSDPRCLAAEVQTKRFAGTLTNGHLAADLGFTGTATYQSLKGQVRIDLDLGFVLSGEVQADGTIRGTARLRVAPQIAGQTIEPEAGDWPFIARPGIPDKVDVKAMQALWVSFTNGTDRPCTVDLEGGAAYWPTSVGRRGTATGDLLVSPGGKLIVHLEQGGQEVASATWAPPAQPSIQKVKIIWDGTELTFRADGG